MLFLNPKRTVAINKELAMSIHKSFFALLTMSILVLGIQSKAHAIPIYDVGDFIAGYGTVVGVEIFDNVDQIHVVSGDTSGPFLLYSETSIENYILVQDIIALYYFASGSATNVPEASSLILLFIGFAGFAFASKGSFTRISNINYKQGL